MEKRDSVEPNESFKSPDSTTTDKTVKDQNKFPPTPTAPSVIFTNVGFGKLYYALKNSCGKNTAIVLTVLIILISSLTSFVFWVKK